MGPWGLLLLHLCCYLNKYMIKCCSECCYHHLEGCSGLIDGCIHLEPMSVTL